MLRDSPALAARLPSVVRFFNFYTHETPRPGALRVADRIRYASLEPDMTGRSRLRPGAPRQQQRRPKTIAGVRVPGAKVSKGEKFFFWLVLCAPIFFFLFLRIWCL